MWALSKPVCQILWALEHWTSHVTSLHILCFATLRFISVRYPHFFNRIRPGHSQVTIVVLWTITLGLSFVPYYVWSTVIKRDSRTPPTMPSCVIWPSNPSAINYIRATFVVLIFIPIILVTIFSLGISVLVLRSRKKRQQNRKSVYSLTNSENASDRKRIAKENKMMLQLGLIVASYLLGYIPSAVYRFWIAETGLAPTADWWFSLIQFISRRISECLNPVFYNVASSSLRNESKRALGFHVTKGRSTMRTDNT
ncbi:uncharacterized protein LOC101242126 [Ciona intestinalis]